MRCRMSNPRNFKVRIYPTFMIDINDYLDLFPGENSSEKFVDIELDEILLSSIPNIWIRQSYVQGYDC